MISVPIDVRLTTEPLATMSATPAEMTATEMTGIEVAGTDVVETVGVVDVIVKEEAVVTGVWIRI
jgi:ribulose 1,5-bisphosphate synthetase/thiazole synthase